MHNTYKHNAYKPLDVYKVRMQDTFARARTRPSARAKIGYSWYTNIKLYSLYTAASITACINV